MITALMAFPRAAPKAGVLKDESKSMPWFSFSSKSSSCGLAACGLESLSGRLRVFDIARITTK